MPKKTDTPEDSVTELDALLNSAEAEKNRLTSVLAAYPSRRAEHVATSNIEALEELRRERDQAEDALEIINQRLNQLREDHGAAVRERKERQWEEILRRGDAKEEQAQQLGHAFAAALAELHSIRTEAELKGFGSRAYGRWAAFPVSPRVFDTWGNAINGNRVRRKKLAPVAIAPAPAKVPVTPLTGRGQFGKPRSAGAAPANR